ncbi:acetone carboxylase subunit gamma [Thermogemmatispora sp.]|uniref:acetone carboxylase subunit gamma n=1 Tax=Thermogemmatispora sp. TaxID=1968838 RepID=UPI0035E4522F
MERLRITEYLDLDLEEEQWYCHRCGRALISARENYKKGCLLYDRDPREIHRPLLEGTYTFSPDPSWIRIIEFYCPSCGTQIETEYLPPGHPITYDIELDLDSLKERLARGEYAIVDSRLVLAGNTGSSDGAHGKKEEKP